VSSNFRLRILLFRGLQRLSTAPAQPHATEIAVYTALFHSRCSSVFVDIQSLSRSLSLSFSLAIFFYRVVKETNINIFEADQVFRQCKKQDLVLLEPSVSYDFIGF